VRTNRFLRLRVGTLVWGRLLISFLTTVAAPYGTHIFKTGEKRGGEREYKGRRRRAN
jgi:hypothetical protein